MAAAVPQFSSLDERQFSLVIEKMADSLGYGAQRSPFIGSSVDYMQSRVYIPGDSVKNMDWRITARSGKPYVKEYEASKHVPVMIVVDDSGSMMTGAAAHTKYEWAILLSGALGLAAIRQLSAAGMFSCGQTDAPLRFTPSLSRAQVYQWVHQLRQISDDAAWRKTELSQTLRDMQISAGEKHLIVILSDLHEKNVASAIKHTAQKHEVIVLRLQDPAERGQIGQGIFRISEAETGRCFVATDTGKNGHDDSLLQSLNLAGVRTMTVHTETDFLPGVRMFLQNTSSYGRR